jgi:trimeric autotransporter adhesin
MSWKYRGRPLVSWLLAVAGVVALAITAFAQVVTTTVTDTIYRADGTVAGGSVIVSWPAFTTALGQTVAAGNTSATLSSSGVLSVQLAPNAGATPLGTYYTVVYHLDDGSVNSEYWVVPASTTPVHTSAVRSSVLPTAVAMQTVSKSYVDTAIAAAVAGAPLDSTNPYVLKEGDTMTGPLVLSGDPTAPAQAATKNYVDVNVAGLASGLGQKVATLPFTTQTVAQPTGTELEVNRLNGVEYASQYQSGRGDNGIANALTSADCASGCEVKAEQTYASTEQYTPSQWNDQTHLEDTRQGQRRDSYLNPESPQVPGTEAGQVIDVTSTRGGAVVHQLSGSANPASVGLQITHEALAGGSNQFPQGIGPTVPYFKTGYSALMVNGTYNTQGQHGLVPMEINCFGVGDCLIGGQFIRASGGFRDNADEGAHPFDLQIREDDRVFTGTCTTGCTTGSTSLMLTPSSNNGTQGDGRFLINMNPSKVISTGKIVGVGASGPNAAVAFSGTSFPVSTFFRIVQAIPSQAHDLAPGTVTLAIATTGLPSGFAANTAAAPAGSGVACVADPTLATNGIENYEMANYSVVDGTHLQLTLNKAHAPQATVAMGGMCGYGLEQKVDTADGIRQIFPVLGSYSATGLYYTAGATQVVGVTGKTSGFINVSLNITSAVRNSNTVTVTTAGNFPLDLNGLTMTISGMTDSSYNGSFAVTTTGPNTFTFAQSGANSTSAGGTVSLLTGSYALYPMAEVLSVMNASTKLVDGAMTLAPNNVAWATNDPVEEPHYFQQKVSPDVEFVSQTIPRPLSFQAAGMQYEGNNGVGLQGWSVTNATPASNYYANGGTHAPPDVAYVAKGVWLRTMMLDAGEQSVFTISCNSRGCGRWNSGYNLFELNSSVAVDTVSFQPTTSTLNFNMRGGSTSIAPQGITTGTINAGTINATTLNAAVSASQLPVFHASGASHAAGAVPDPGATAGTTRFLREDGTWATPLGGSTSGSSTGVVAGATADYDFQQGSGSVLVDKSGNSNNGTLGSGTNAPTWTSTGLQFTVPQNVALPSALNGTRTFFMAVYVNPITSGPQPYNQYPYLINSSIQSAGFNLSYSPSGGNIYRLQSYSGGGLRTLTKNTFSGFHVIAVTLGDGTTDTDHFYIDGQEQMYTSQGASAGKQTSGNLFLGTTGVSPTDNSGFIGTMYRLVAYPTQLAAGNVQTISAAIRNEVASRGVQTSPQQQQLITPQLHAIGDSITIGAGVSTPWPSLLSLANQPNYTVQNWGIGGTTMTAMQGSEPNRVATMCAPSAGPAIAVLFAGTNDMAQMSMAPQDVWSAAISEIQILKQAGCRVFVGTMLSRGGSFSDGNTADQDKGTYDALILSQARNVGADGVVDFAANPLLGADGAYSNSTYFQGDLIHPTQAGQALLAQAASNTLNRYFGYNDANPHVITGATVTLASGDGAVTAVPTANAAYTMPDCTGPSGATYTISNPQSAFTVTIVGRANQPINGVTTPIAIPPNSTVTLKDVANPKNVSGCHWAM